MWSFILWVFLLLNIIAFFFGVTTNGDIWPWNLIAIVFLSIAIILDEA